MKKSPKTAIRDLTQEDRVKTIGNLVGPVPLEASRAIIHILSVMKRRCSGLQGTSANPACKAMRPIMDRIKKMREK